MEASIRFVIKFLWVDVFLFASFVLPTFAVDRTTDIAVAQLKRMEWKVDDVTREALLYIPQQVDTKAPVIFAFHGHGGSMRQAASSFGYHQLWPEALVVYMQGLS